MPNSSVSQVGISAHIVHVSGLLLCASLMLSSVQGAAHAQEAPDMQWIVFPSALDSGSGGGELAVDPAGNAYFTWIGRGISWPFDFWDVLDWQYGGFALLATYTPEGMEVRRQTAAYGRDVYKSVVAMDDDGRPYLATTGLIGNAGDYMDLTKLDANGNEIWKQDGGGENAYIHAVFIDGSHRVTICGSFRWAGSLSGVLFPDDFPYNEVGGAFVARYTESGDLSWVATTENGHCSDVAADESGSAYVAGDFKESIAIGDTTLTSTGAQDGFVAKYAPDGRLDWVKQTGGTGGDLARDVAVGPSGRLYVAGRFSSEVSFDGVTLSSKGDTDVFVARYTFTGEQEWVVRAGGTDEDRIAALSTGPSGDLYLAGDFLGGRPDFGSTELTSKGGRDMYLARLDTSGRIVWVLNVGSSKWDEAHDVVVGEDGGIFLSGRTSGSTFSDGAVKASGSGLFLARFSSSFSRGLSPTSFELSTPAGGALLTDAPVLSWEESEDPEGEALHYRLYAGTNEQLSDATPLFLRDTAYSVQPSQLDVGQYWWRVEAHDGYGGVTSTETRRFVYDRSPEAPSSVALDAPGSAEVVSVETPAFTWRPAVDPDERVHKPTYRLLIAGDPDFSNLIHSIETPDTTYALSDPLQDNRTYYWKVEAVDRSGLTSSSEARSFIIDLSREPPSSFSMITPVSGKVLSRDALLFTWSRASDPDWYDELTYRLLIAADSDFSDVIRSVETADTTLTLSEPLPESRTYYWKVEAVDRSGLSSSTSGAAFKLRALADLELESFPNPFRATTTIRFGVPEAASVRLRIYDLAGREVATLMDADEAVGRGWYEVDFEADGLSSGIYFCRIEAGGATETHQIVLVR